MTVKNSQITIPMIVDKESGDSSGQSYSPPRPTSLAIMKNVEEAKLKRKKKKRAGRRLSSHSFNDLYKRTGEVLGEGSYGKVETCINAFTGMEYAVKTIEKNPGYYSRSKVMKEIEIYYVVQGHTNIIQLIEYFEEADRFYLIFEKICGGPLLQHIQARTRFTEAEASTIIKDLAGALKFLHSRGIAHRDLKPENVLCVNDNSACQVKLCDFDLCSEAHNKCSTPQLLTPVGSCDYMAPEVVNTFIADDYDYDDLELHYDKKCDIWSLGVLMYILLCGYPPFSGNCGSDCGWNLGEECKDCNALLFFSIREGRVVFLEKDWSNISTEAKHLIKSLLEKDVSKRLDAEEVLNHPWIVNEGCSNTLVTPHNLARHTSLKELLDFTETAADVNRAMVEQRLSESVYRRPNKIPFQRALSSCSTFALSPPAMSPCSLLERRRNKNIPNNVSKFSSIHELEQNRNYSKGRFNEENAFFSGR